MCAAADCWKIVDRCVFVGSVNCLDTRRISGVTGVKGLDVLISCVDATGLTFAGAGILIPDERGGSIGAAGNDFVTLGRAT